VLLLCGIAQGQDGLARLVSRDALDHLRHPLPEVRGEAALVVATRSDLAQQPALLAMAKERDAPARQRALIALGLMGSPAAVQLLGDVLADTTTRGEDDGIAAAFGLGLVPEQRASTTTTQVLLAIGQGSWKRQRETLVALLLAMTMQPDRGEAVALRQHYDDESNRDPEVRGLLLGLLLEHDRTLEPKLLRRVLERGSEPERQALLDWLDDAPALDPQWVPTIERLAGHAEDVRTRIAALVVLTHRGYPQALDLALRALRSSKPAECGQALRTILAIGGARRLLAFAPRVIEEPDGHRKAEWLAQWQAPLTEELEQHCRRLATDPAQPWALRTAATMTLVRGVGGAASAQLRDAFRGTSDDDALPALAMLLRQFEPEPVPLDRLLDSGTDLRAEPRRWLALLRAEHPEAERQVLLGLQSRDVDPAAVLPALRTWRVAHVLRLPAAHRDVAPALLRGLLGGD
jgi:hypothetical protein